MSEPVYIAPSVLSELLQNLQSLTHESAASGPGSPRSAEAWDALAPVEKANFLRQVGPAFHALAQAATRREPGVMWVVDDELVSQLQSFSEEQAAAAKKAGRLTGPITQYGQFREVVMDDHDYFRWAASFLHWRLFHKHTFLEPPANAVTELPDDARIALFADWGSGRYGAPVIAKTIQSDPNPLDVAIHLGDVYYSGRPDEVQKHLLDKWPHRAGLRSLLLNGNHEMYSGGCGLANAMAQFGQPYTYFALRNKEWLIVALDTAVKKRGFIQRQLEWVQNTVAAADGRKVILLSHHQPFSAFGERLKSALVRKLRPVFSDPRVRAWYWGHEHRCVVFDPSSAWGEFKGRCIGHGGYPYDIVKRDPEWSLVEGSLAQSRWYTFAPDKKQRWPGGRVLGDGNPDVKDDRGRKLEDLYGAHGYVMLKLSGPTCQESFHRPDGACIFSQQL